MKAVCQKLDELLACTQHICQCTKDTNRSYVLYASDLGSISERNNRTLYPVAMRVSITTATKECFVVELRSMPGLYDVAVVLVYLRYERSKDRKNVEIHFTFFCF